MQVFEKLAEVSSAAAVRCLDAATFGPACFLQKPAAPLTARAPLCVEVCCILADADSVPEGKVLPRKLRRSIFALSALKIPACRKLLKNRPRVNL